MKIGRIFFLIKKPTSIKLQIIQIVLKKTYEERNKPENILVECLYKLEVTETQNARYLGAAEAILIMENFIETPGGSPDYKEKEEKFLFMTFKTKESYREYIIRLTKEYLTEKGVL